jgi:predicted nucleic acid-binding protein
LGVPLSLYAESSAVLAWLLAEPDGDPVRDGLRDAQVVIASDLTLIECERVLTRAVALGRLSEGDAAERRALLRRAAGHWIVLRLDDEVAERAGRPFPNEPIRTLDAIHLASALVGSTAVPGLRLASLDQRIRGSAQAMGLELWPS